MFRRMYTKYKELFWYGVFGVCTTIVNFLVYGLCTRLFGIGYLPSSLIGWFFSVLFAYVTNRMFVFHSGVYEHTGVLYEILKFYGVRVGTELLDMLGLYIFTVRLGFYDLAVKIILNIVVIILNFLFSKIFVFRKNT